MRISAMGLILADHNRVHLGDLSEPRALAAMPLGGRYRIIDFILSNMVNTGMTQVGVIALTKYKSLMDHLGTGASWDLDRMKSGLSLLPPYINSIYTNSEISDLTGLLDFIKHCTDEYAVIADSNIVMNYSLEEIIEAHASSEADLTIMYNRDGNKYGSPNISLGLDRKGFVDDVLIDDESTKRQRSSLGILVCRRDFLVQILSKGIARGRKEFSIEAILKKYNDFKIQGFEYKGFCLRINSIASYFTSSMRLLEEEARKAMFVKERPVYTKVKNEAPALFVEGNETKNCLVSDGCHISGKVSNSILFRGVKIGLHSVVENCIIMQDVEIGDGAVLKNVIIDKDTVVRKGTRLQGQADYPFVIEKGVVV